MKRFKELERPHDPRIDERFHQLEYGNVSNVIYWWEFLKQIEEIPGDIVECGVGRGRSLLLIGTLNDILDVAEGGQRRIYGYDSFAGFPEPTPEDNSSRNPRKGEWSTSPSGKYTYTAGFILQVMKDAGVPCDQLTLVPGFFEDSLPRHPDRPIALLHIDGDLYSSYLATLESRVNLFL